MHYQLGNMCKSRYILYQWMIWIMYAGIMVKSVSLVILICEVISVLSRFVIFLRIFISSSEIVWSSYVSINYVRWML